MDKQKRITEAELSSLKPFHGYQSSFVPLSSGYYVYIAIWDSTPTSFPHMSNVWLITPEDKRILFADPPASSEVVCIYHEFQEIHGASIDLEPISEEQFQLRCRSQDGDHDLKILLRLHETLASRILLALGSGPPTPARTSPAILGISDFLVNALVARSGSVLLGRTETGQPFYHGETERLSRVRSGSTTLNGRDLGQVSRPTWSVEFGDAVPYYRPVLKQGTLYIPYEPEMLEKNL